MFLQIDASTAFHIRFKRTFFAVWVALCEYPQTSSGILLQVLKIHPLEALPALSSTSLLNTTKRTFVLQDHAKNITQKKKGNFRHYVCFFYGYWGRSNSVRSRLLQAIRVFWDILLYNWFSQNWVIQTTCSSKDMSNLIVILAASQTFKVSLLLFSPSVLRHSYLSRHYWNLTTKAIQTTEKSDQRKAGCPKEQW